MDNRDEFEAWYAREYLADGQNITETDRALLRSGYRSALIDRSFIAWNAARASQWRPIAEAPKDGSLVLIGFLKDNGKWFCETAYWDYRDWSASAGWLVTNPTHFMPLPQPPENV